MPTNRTRIRRGIRKARLTPEAIAAWTACDQRTLHCALGLKPWEPSPLPQEITALGCSEADLDRPRDGRMWTASLPKAVALQRQLLAVAGWPDCREAYERNLVEAESWLAYVRRPPVHRGTGTDPASRAAKVQDAEADVAYRRKLLAELA